MQSEPEGKSQQKNQVFREAGWKGYIQWVKGKSILDMNNEAGFIESDTQFWKTSGFASCY